MLSETYMTPAEAAKYLRTSVSTLAKRRVYNSSPTYIKLGRAIRYRRSDLDAFMEAQLATSTSNDNSNASRGRK